MPKKNAMLESHKCPTRAGDVWDNGKKSVKTTTIKNKKKGYAKNDKTVEVVPAGKRGPQKSAREKRFDHQGRKEKRKR